MPGRCYIIGKTNTGKTLFLLNFLRYNDVNRYRITFQHPEGYHYTQLITFDQAKQELVGSKRHTTLSLQVVSATIAAGKGKKEVAFVDTTGLIDGIHEDPNVRRAVAQTLESIRWSRMVFHLIDAAGVGRKDPYQNITEIDYQISSYARKRGAYVILANKMDLPESRKGLEIVKQSFPGQLIIPISASTGYGFREVKSFVAKFA